MPDHLESTPETLLAYLFRSCVAYYNAKPWKLMAASDQIRINIDHGAPFFAYALGGGNAGAPGLSIISVFRQGMEPEPFPNSVAFDGVRLSMQFVPEMQAPQWLRDARRINKWPLASPSAFPTFMAIDANGDSRAPDHDELRALGVAISVVAGFAATKRKQIESRRPHGDVILVRDDAGIVKKALVQFPFDENDLSGWKYFKLATGSTKQPALPLHELWNAALDLPDTSRTLDRLVWSFFQDVVPGYSHDEIEENDADHRFLAWALFAYRSTQGTLAQQALAKLMETKTSDALAVHHRLVEARAGVFRVVSVQRNVGLLLEDMARGTTLDVMERSATRHLGPGNGVLGMVHPISDTQWILAPGAAYYPSLPEVTVGENETPVERFAPSMEVIIYGANTDWIQEMEPDDVPYSYETFADALASTGDTLPEFDDLQVAMAHASQPTEIVQRLGEHVAWWTETELNVLLAFVMRIWNMTPRDELGGRTPEEMPLERPRASRSAPAGPRRRTR